MIVPWDFQEDVERAQNARCAGDLRLLAEEARGFEWGSEGLRLVGEAQFGIQAFAGGKETFEAVRRLDPDDLQANYRLGTIYKNRFRFLGRGQLTRASLQRSPDLLDVQARDWRSPVSIFTR
jgi:hypothetical protein